VKRVKFIFPKMDDVEFLQIQPNDDSNAFQVNRALWTRRSATIRDLCADGVGTDTPIPLPSVGGKVVKIVNDWLELHKDDPEPAPQEADAKPKLVPLIDDATAALAAVDQEFFSKYSVDDMFPVLQGANYLHIKPLLDAGAKEIARRCLGLTEKQTYELFHVDTPLTEQEIEATRKENTWLNDQ
jgi:hypothetical protein